MSSITSDLYKEILKPSKSHTNRIILIVLFKSTLIQLEKDLYRRIYKREKSVKTFYSNWRPWNKVNWSYLNTVFWCKQWSLVRCNVEKAIFKPENKTIYSMNNDLWCLKLAEYCVQKLKKLAIEEGEGSASTVRERRDKGREMTTFCSMICEFLLFFCCFLQ